jgi:hypothetical protein
LRAVVDGAAVHAARRSTATQAAALFVYGDADAVLGKSLRGGEASNTGPNHGKLLYGGHFSASLCSLQPMGGSAQHTPHS